MLFKNSTLSIVASLYQYVISAFSGIIIARLLGPEGKGVVYLIIQYSSTISLFISLGLGASYLYHLRSNIYSKNIIITHAILFTVIISVSVITIYYIYSKTSLNIMDKDINNKYIHYIYMLIVLNIIVKYSGSVVLNELNGMLSSVIIDSIGSLFYIILMVVLLKYYQCGVYGVIVSLTLSLCLRSLLLNIYIFKDYKLVLNKSLIECNNSIVLYGLGNFIMNIMITMASRIDSFIIAYYTGKQTLGIYSVAVSISEITLLVPIAVGVATFPIITSKSDGQKLKITLLSGRLSLFFGVLSGLVLIALGYPLINIMFGAKFLGAYLPLILLIPGLIANCLAYPYINYYSSMGKPLMNALLFFIGLILNITLNLIFTPKYGILGASLVTSIGYCFIVYLYITLLSRKNNISRKQLMIITSDDIKLISVKLHQFYGKAILTFRKICVE